MLIRQVEKFLRHHGMPATVFGRLAAHDPRLVHDLRKGREPRPPMEHRVTGFIAGFEAAEQSARENSHAA